ncbi:hypothetical protein SAMN06265379_102218 [Saccharicrinis carchari]|uniref:Uncharacterized protein n=1 Tax=Saccharicrinis carchari TaxID=1168039 RepID=A0A521C0I4_SACCC|nr:hypothetical protein SAMN06265379_102218 [Saccharicrinis carchari]
MTVMAIIWKTYESSLKFTPNSLKFAPLYKAKL